MNYTPETHCAICEKPILREEQSGFGPLRRSVRGEMYLTHNACVTEDQLPRDYRDTWVDKDHTD